MTTDDANEPTLVIEPMKTVADFRRAARKGSRWQVTNNLHPHTTGLRVITDDRGEPSYRGVRADGSTFDNGGLSFPKRNLVRFDGGSVHFLLHADSDDVAFTWTRLCDDRDVPAAVRVKATS